MTQLLQASKNSNIKYNAVKLRYKGIPNWPKV